MVISQVVVIHGTERQTDHAEEEVDLYNSGKKKSAKPAHRDNYELTEGRE